MDPLKIDRRWASIEMDVIYGICDVESDSCAQCKSGERGVLQIVRDEPVDKEISGFARG
jgi:hypothetical protein